MKETKQTVEIVASNMWDGVDQSEKLFIASWGAWPDGTANKEFKSDLDALITAKFKELLTEIDQLEGNRAGTPEYERGYSRGLSDIRNLIQKHID